MLPFRLFIFSYTILGPLHYLTEISWLHKSQYFTRKKWDFLLLVFLGVLSYLANFKLHLPALGSATIFISLIAGFCFLAFDKFSYKLIGITGATVAAYLFYKAESIYPTYFLYVAVFLPTIIHVSLFTLLFMVYGSVMGKSMSGFATCITFIIACSIFFIYTPNLQYQVTDMFYNPLRQYFSIISVSLMELFGYIELPKHRNPNNEELHYIFFSKEGQMFMRFIAFIYTYHYLNWFSKTSIIKWHQVSIDKLIIVTTLWLLSIAVYIYEYGLGFQVLFTLSIMHVFLEFPLNFKTIGAIGKSVTQRS